MRKCPFAAQDLDVSALKASSAPIALLTACHVSRRANLASRPGGYCGDPHQSSTLSATEIIVDSAAHGLRRFALIRDELDRTLSAAH
jgi:hypothetical protein